MSVTICECGLAKQFHELPNDIAFRGNKPCSGYRTSVKAMKSAWLQTEKEMKEMKAQFLKIMSRMDITCQNLTHMRSEYHTFDPCPVEVKIKKYIEELRNR
jgi:hypothetical protein